MNGNSVRVNACLVCYFDRGTTCQVETFDNADAATTSLTTLMSGSQDACADLSRPSAKSTTVRSGRSYSLARAQGATAVGHDIKM